MSERMMPKRGFTNMNHRLQCHFDLSLQEYILVDMIFELGTTKGYCYMSKPKMAEQLGTSERYIYMLIKSVVEKGIIKKVGHGKLKAPEKWHLWKDDKEDLPSTEPEQIFMPTMNISSGSNMKKTSGSTMNISSGYNKSNNKSIQKDNNKGEWRKVTDCYKEEMDKAGITVITSEMWGLFSIKVKPTFNEIGADKTIQALHGFFNDSWVVDNNFPIYTFPNKVGVYLKDDKKGDDFGLGAYREKNRRAYQEEVSGVRSSL